MATFFFKSGACFRGEGHRLGNEQRVISGGAQLEEI
jgi:hypothetical protein